MKVMKTMLRTYAELRRLETFEERYHYLKLGGNIGESTFGFDRWINQRFYKSQEWKNARNHVILRDNGCDLGIPGYEIYSDLRIHHMNPFTVDDIENGDTWLINPLYLITTSLRTHNAIHYGDESLLPRGPIKRERGDTTLW
jgi:hypothetical protein